MHCHLGPSTHACKHYQLNSISTLWKKPRHPRPRLPPSTAFAQQHIDDQKLSLRRKKNTRSATEGNGIPERIGDRNGTKNERKQKRTNERTNEPTNEPTNERTNERTNHQRTIFAFRHFAISTFSSEFSNFEFSTFSKVSLTSTGFPYPIASISISTRHQKPCNPIRR